MSCNFMAPDYSECKKRPWTDSEKHLFDSLQKRHSFDSITIHRTNFNECDEFGYYSISVHSRKPVTKESVWEFKRMSDSLVVNLYSFNLSTRVGAVIETYRIGWELNDRRRRNGYEEETFGPFITYKKEDLEKYTGIQYNGDYHGSTFTRKRTNKTIDTLVSSSLEAWK